MKALGQHVQQEAPDELTGRDRHGLVALRSLDPVVLDLERDAVLVGSDEPAVADRDAVRVAREVGENLFRSGERALGVDMPVGLVERFEPRLEGGLVGEM